MRLVMFSTLVLAASTAVAQAPPRVDPRPVPVHPNDDRVHRDRDVAPYDDDFERYDRDMVDRDRYERWDRRTRGRWMPLMKYGDARDGRHLIDVGGRVGRIDKLRVEAVRGAPVIRRIAIEYRNGEREVLRLDTHLRRGQGQVIDLGRDRRVDRIVVITDRRAPGIYSVFGT